MLARDAHPDRMRVFHRPPSNRRHVRESMARNGRGPAAVREQNIADIFRQEDANVRCTWGHWTQRQRGSREITGDETEGSRRGPGWEAPGAAETKRRGAIRS